MFRSLSVRRWVRELIHSWYQGKQRTIRRHRPTARLQLEPLESRVVPSTWTVTNTNSSGAGSLFKAVQSADTDTSPALINFDPTVFDTPQTITLTASLNLDNPNQPIVLQGPTAATLTISGNSSGGATIQDFVASGGVATIENLTIANGNAGTNDGGGVDITGGTVTIDNCVITNNTAVSGGGIMVVNNAEAIIEYTTLSDNTAGSSNGAGGGLCQYGNTESVNMFGCAVIDNTCISGGQFGGGLAFIGEGGSSPTFDPSIVMDTTIAGNTAVGCDGGGVENDFGNVVLENCTITGNSASSGGGIRCDYYYVTTLMNDVCWNNTAATAPDDYNGSYNPPVINYTLVGNTTDTFAPGNAVGDILNVSTSPSILNSLANNGGPTQSISLVPGSLPVDSAGALGSATFAVAASDSTVDVTNGGLFAGNSLPLLTSGSYYTVQLDGEEMPVTGVTLGDYLTSATINGAGGGFQVGDVLTLTGGTGTSATFDVTSVNGSGGITGFKIVNPGMYTVAPSDNGDASGGHGSGASFNLVYAGGAQLNVTRAGNGTTAASHTAGTNVFLVSDQRGYDNTPVNPAQVDMGAVQTTGAPATGGSGSTVSQLVFTVQPTSADISPTVEAEDSGGNPVAGAVISLSAAPGSLTGTTVATTNAAGLAIFSGLKDTVGTQTETAADGSVTATSNSFIVKSTSDALWFTTSPTSTTAGSSLGTVTLQESDGGDPTPGATVSLSLSPSATLSGTITGTTNAAGVVVFSNLSIATAGTYTLFANAPGAGASSMTFVISGSSGPSLVVTNTNASGTGSLAQAVLNADSYTSPAVITFDPSDFTSAATITLTSTLTLSNTTEPITIDGSGAGPITVSGGGTVQDFVVNAFVTATFDDLTISGGSTAVDGGAIDDSGSSLTVNNCTISQNSANIGGGIELGNGASATITNSTFSHNYAVSTGGAIENDDQTLTLVNCTFSGNVYQTGGGAGIYNNDTVTALNCTFSDDDSAISNTNAGFFTLADSFVQGNDNGGFYNVGSATLTNDTFANNSAANGAAIYNAGFTMTLANCTISDNQGGAYGGGLFNAGPATLINCIVTGNTSADGPDITDNNGMTISGTDTLVGNSSMSNISAGNGNVLDPTASVLGTLGNYGGVDQGSSGNITVGQTFPLASGSPAIGTGGAVTTLGVALGSSGNSLTAVSSVVFGSSNLPALASGWYTIQIDSEQMIVTSMTNGTLTVTRGANGTTAAAHNSGAAIYLVSDQRGELVPSDDPPAVDMGAAENPGAYSSALSFGTQPSSVTVGSSIGTITVSDLTAGTPVAGATITLAISSGSLTGATTATTDSSGVATFSGLSVNTGGTYSLTASASDAAGATSSSFVISSDVATGITFTVEPSSTTAGTVFNPIQVKAVDSSGNPVASYTITLGTTPSTLMGTLTATTNSSGIATFSDVWLDTTGSYVLTASATGVADAISSEFVISAEAIATLIFTQQPVSTSAGSSLGTIVVTAEDQYGNDVSGASVSLSLSAGSLVGGSTATTNAAGQATFSGLSVDQVGTYSLTATSSSITAPSSSFTIGLSTGSWKITCLSEPSTTAAGATINPVTIQVVDEYGNPVANDSVSLTLVPQETLGGTTTASTNASGQVVFANLVEDLAGTYTLTASAAGVTTAAASSSFVINAGAPSTITFLTQPSSAQAGATLNAITVQIADSFGNFLSHATVSLTLAAGALSSGGAPLTTSSTGQAIFSGLSEDLAGTYSLVASVANSSLSLPSNSFVISAAVSTAKLSFVTEPTTTIAGTALSPITVQVADKYGNAIIGTNVSITSAPRSFASGAAPVITNGSGQAVFSSLIEDYVGTYTLTASATGLVNVLSTPFTITPATQTAVLTFLTQPSNVSAGSTLNVISMLLADQFGNAVSGVPIGLTLSAGTFNSGTTSVSTGSTGVAVFTGLVEDVAGTYSLSAAASGFTSVSSKSFTIGLATTTEKLVFITEPTSTVAGVTLNAVTVQLADEFGNGAVNVPINIALNSTTVKLSTGTTPLTTNGQGEVVFSDLSENLAGSYALTATASGATAVTSSWFSITPATATAVPTFVTQPNSTTAQAVLSPITVRVADKYGNLLSGQAVNIALASGTLSAGTTPITTGTTGLAVFSDLAEHVAGTYQLTATTPNQATATSGSFVITAVLTSTSQLTYLTELPGETAGVAFSPVTVQLADNYGNAVAGTTVSLGISTGGKLITAPVPAKTNAAGQAVFSGLAESLTGTFSLIATVSGLTPASSNSFAVSAGAVAKLTFLSEPTSASAGTIIKAITVLAADAYGNETVGVPVSIALLPGALTSGTTPLTTGQTGEVVFSDLVETHVGTYELTASAGTVSDASTSFSISASGAYALAFVSQPSSTAAGSTLGAVTVSVTDQYGNGVVSSPVTISLGTTGLAGVASVSTNTLGYAIFNELSVSDPGSDTLTASSTASGTSSAVSNSFTITPLAAAKLVFGNQPASTYAGASMTAVSVMAEDMLGNGVAGVTVTLAQSAGTLSGTTTAVSGSNGAAVFSGLSEAKAGTFSLIASTTGLTNAASNSFMVASAGAGTISFLSEPSAAVASGSGLGAITVKVTDSSGNLLSGSPITMSIAGGQLGGTTTLMTGSNGEAIFTTLTSSTSGTFQLIATDAPISADSNDFSVLSSTDKLTFSTQPSAAAAGTALGPVTVSLTTSTGSPLANVPVTVGLVSGSVTGTTVVSTNSTGQATFSNLDIATAGTYNLTAHALDVASVTSSSFVVTSGAAAGLSFVSVPSTDTAGSVISPVTVKAVDAHGNLAAGVVVTIGISTGNLSGTTTATTNSAGQAIFTGLSTTTAGPATFTASSAGLSSVSSSSFTVHGAAAVGISFVNQLSSSAVAGAALGPITVEAVDQYGNGVAGVSVGILTSLGTVNGTTTLTTNASGLAIFTNLSIAKIGTYSLTATSGSLARVSTNTFTITPSLATAKISFVTEPASSTSSTLAPVTVQVMDEYGNAVTGIAITLKLSTGTLGGVVTVATGSNGRAVFSQLADSTHATGLTLIASAPGLASVSSTTFSVT